MHRAFAGSLALVALLAGCAPDGPELATVAGTVRLDGQPLEEATVTFIPSKGGRPSAARTDPEGRYELVYTRDRNGALLGEHTVRISTFRKGDPEQDIAPVLERVPVKYNIQSELKKTVEPNGNVFDFDLTSEGKIVQRKDG